MSQAPCGSRGKQTLCIGRIYPPRKDRLVKFPIPPITCSPDARISAVACDAATGNVTLSEAAEVAEPKQART
jgi:hypothetical protein